MVSEIKKYLQMHVEMTRSVGRAPDAPSIWSFFLENSVECGAKVPCAVPVGPARECFKNTLLALPAARAKDPNWVYCEGYAANTVLGFPCHHAWLYNVATGEVMDPTASWTGRDEVHYFGVPFNTEYVLAHALSDGWPSPCFDGEMFRPVLFDEGRDKWGARREALPVC